MTHPKASVAILLGFVCVGLIVPFWLGLRASQGDPLVCESSRGSVVYDECVKSRADVFFKIDYSECKDLAKAFLTLLTAVFVASITFSEKIVDLKTAGGWAKWAMVACWGLLLAAIAFCGAGLTYMIFALGEIEYYARAPWRLEFWAGALFGVSGIWFGLSLCAMLIAALPALVPASPGALKSARQPPNSTRS